MVKRNKARANAHNQNPPETQSKLPETQADFSDERTTQQFKYVAKVRLTLSEDKIIRVKREKWKSGYHMAAREKGRFVASKKWEGGVKNQKQWEKFNERYGSERWRTYTTDHGEKLDMRQKRNQDFIFGKMIEKYSLGVPARPGKEKISETDPRFKIDVDSFIHKYIYDNINGVKFD